MSVVKFDNKAIRSAVPPVAGYTLLWDRAVRGFGCRVTAAGAKSFVLDYRASGRQRRYTLGSWPDWSVAAARNEAMRLKRAIDQGRDPMAERYHARHAPTVASLCDRYLAEHVEVHNKANTANEVRRMITKVVKPKIGQLKVETVKHADIERLHRDLRGTPRQANLVVAMLSKMMNLAEHWQLRPLNSNPCKHLRRYPENARDKYASPDELERIGAALRELEVDGKINPADAACIRFLALVGCRLSEAVTLDLRDVDFRAGSWALPDAKAGRRTVILGVPALALLADLGRTEGYAFVRSSGRPVSWHMIEYAWSKIRTRAGIAGLRLHDLRHTVGTYAGASGASAFLVRDLLGHRNLAMTNRYVSRHTDPLRATADVVSGQIAAALEGNAADVVKLKQRG
jgi:integrase